jgi:hypothetical protein
LEQALGKTGQIGLKPGPVFPLNPRRLLQKFNHKPHEQDRNSGNIKVVEVKVCGVRGVRV